MAELFENESPTTEMLIRYNQKMNVISSEMFELLHWGWREYKPIVEVVEELIETLEKYKTL